MRALLALVFAVALVPPAGAEGCVPGTSTSSAEMTVIELPGCNNTVCYVVVDHDASGCMGAVWVYPESNGVPGLQRADECRDDTCGGMTEADTYLL